MLPYLNDSNQRIFYSFALIVYSGLIYLLSDRPGMITLDLFPHQDKLVHGIAYGVMAGLGRMAFLCWPQVKPVDLWAWFYAALYGASDEWHQSFVPGREVDFLDWGADALGAALVLLVWRYWRSRAARINS
ncbi:MAG: VanZ family protein [Magnetococcales bacterium]|nr:VanZ family protein [Magnetococcales bacterium]